MKIRADIRLTCLDEVIAAKNAVQEKADDLERTLGDLMGALIKMGVEISQPTDGAAD